MDTKYIRNSFRLLYGMLLLTVIYSCANIGSPNGGPYDETPPKFVSSTPVPNQINYTGKKIEILFDELIQIEKPSIVKRCLLTKLFFERGKPRCAD